MLQCTEQFSDTLLCTCHGSQPWRRGGLASISDRKSVDHITHVAGPRIMEGENAALLHSCTGIQPHQPVLAWAPSLVLNCLSDHISYVTYAYRGRNTAAACTFSSSHLLASVMTGPHKTIRTSSTTSCRTASNLKPPTLDRTICTNTTCTRASAASKSANRLAVWPGSGNKAEKQGLRPLGMCSYRMETLPCATRSRYRAVTLVWCVP